MPLPGKGKWALVTGASAGIGETFARRLALDGYSVVLVARREERLRALAAELERDHGVGTFVVPLDLSHPSAPKTLFDTVETAGHFVEVLINNAGFGSHGSFLDLDPDREMAMVDLNCRTLVGVSRYFAVPMKRERRGGIIHLASVASFQPCPYMATYGATKGFILLFSEALWAELSEFGISVTALCPGPTATEFFDVAKYSGFAQHAFEKPELVVERGLSAMRRGRPTVVSGLFNTIRSLSPRLIPRWLAARIAALLLR
jgi:short-subunit dehydrogenase